MALELASKPENSTDFQSPQWKEHRLPKAVLWLLMHTGTHAHLHSLTPRTVTTIIITTNLKRNKVTRIAHQILIPNTDLQDSNGMSLAQK